jgi:hypothetical protein
MTPRRYGPLPYVPITRRPKLTWPNGARVALWVNPNIEFFGLDDVMPGNLNERVPREHAAAGVWVRLVRRLRHRSGRISDRGLLRPRRKGEG